MVPAATSIAWNRKSANAVVYIKHILTYIGSPLDSLAVFETASQSGSTAAPTRYAIRQALDQEYQKYILRQRANARQARHKARGDLGSKEDPEVEDKDTASTEEVGVNMKPVAVKRDFFGRVIHVSLPTIRDHSTQGESEGLQDSKLDEEENVWVSYHEGFSNAVRKPITLDELMRGF